jgi:hypothetical protein
MMLEEGSIYDGGGLRRDEGGGKLTAEVGGL